MMSTPGWARLQARLQARHAERLTPAQWNRLVAVDSLEAFISRGRETALLGWLEGVDPFADAHHLEERMRMVWIRQVGMVAAWTPKAWRAAVLWLAVLPDLGVAAWRRGRMGADYPWFERLEGLERLGLGQSEDPFAGWVARWQALWPPEAEARRALTGLVELLELYRSRLHDHDAPESWTLWAELRAELGLRFRRLALQPGALFVHLGLTGLELLRLRGELCRRALFVHKEQAA
ncbi:MAG: V-type ATPase subunit [Magnetococcus sp. YQC-9]